MKRRTQPRSSRDDAATSIVQLLIRQPAQAAATLERDLTAGADPALLLGLLDAVEAILVIRGVDRRVQMAALRKRIEAGLQGARSKVAPKGG